MTTTHKTVTTVTIVHNSTTKRNNGYWVFSIPIRLVTTVIILIFVATISILTYTLTPIGKNTKPTTSNWTLTPNGNFEEMPTNWPEQLENQKNKFVRSTDMAFDGIFSMKTIVNNHSEGFANISNPIGVETGKKYTISVYFNTTDFLTGNLYLDLSNTHNNFNIKSTPGIAGWQFKYATFTAQSPTIRIRLVCDGDIKSTQSGYIDCIALTPTEHFRP